MASPVGADGYPQPIFDKETGEIDPKVAAYWKEHYDLNAKLQRDWTTLGPKLQGKIHLYVGSDDTYFLNDAVYLMEDFLKTTGTSGKGVPYDGEVLYGPRAEHCCERRSDLAKRIFASALQHDVPAEDHGTDRQDCTGGSGCNELEVLVKRRIHSAVIVART